MKEFIVILIILFIIHWYFNIRGKYRCITIIPECDGVDCIKSNKVSTI